MKCRAISTNLNKFWQIGYFVSVDGEAGFREASVTSTESVLNLVFTCDFIIITSHMESLQAFRKLVCCIDDPLFPNPYNFNFGTSLNLEHNKLLFESNFVRTSKYRWYDFLPKSLIQQFYRLANVYFLFIGILQSISIISPLGPLTAWGPLLVVLAISIIRQGYEDYQRYKSDMQLNHEYKTHILRQGRFVEVEWQQVLIGDICRVKEKDLFPADLILLASEHLEGNAFIETASLDGEKNLKPRNAYPQTQRFNTEQKIAQFVGSWEGKIPDKDTEDFLSTLLFGDTKIVYQKQKNLLWRGTRLMNTKWIYGLAIYTGRNTKIMKNSQSSANKMSQIETKVNYILGFILLVQVLLSLFCGVLAGVFNSNNKDTFTYLPFSYTAAIDGVLSFFSYIVLINTMIPISLIVSIEIVKVAQSTFIDKDRFMYSQLRKTGAVARSSSLNEELGQIQHIFSDKTGTLTTNRMEFKIAVIGSRMFGDLGLIVKDQNYPPQEQKGFRDDSLTRIMKQPEARADQIHEIFVRDRERQAVIKFNNIRAIANEYLTALSIAHEVVVQQLEQTHEKVYQGPSPDEITLVDAAKQMGFEFVNSTQKSTEINRQGEKKRFDLLECFPFNSDRKRMSVIVRDGPHIKMYIKGADSIIKERLADDQILNLDDELTKFSNIGLRTLLIGMRLISEQEYKEFIKKMQSLPNDSSRDNELKKLVNGLQTNLYLIGATAVLDRLQDQVPQTIRDLIRANIKVWMLTGDKMETAENIAKSCNLIQPQFHVLKCKFPTKSPEDVSKTLKQARIQSQRLYKAAYKITLMVEGSDLVQITKQQENQDHFIAIAEKCQSVVCCRLLPMQKAEVVKLVRKKLGKITLAIGDGANDVPMIKAAHIGIGLFGQEGMGAVQASDYALPEFRMLWRLLLVHGRWNYVRIAEMILYFFYKNMLFTFPQFIFAFYCGYSGQTLFEDMYVSLFNLIFTSIPLIVRAIFEQDINYLTKRHVGPNSPESSAQILRSTLKLPPAYDKLIPKGYVVNKYIYRLFPKLYYIGQQNLIFNYKNFIFWILQGVLESILITLFALYILDAPSMNGSGYSTDMWITSLTIYSMVITIVTFKLATHSKFMSALLFFSLLVLGIGVYVGYMWISNYYFSYSIVNTTYMFYTSGQTYFMVLFGVCVVLFVDGMVLTMDEDNSGLLHKVRNIIDANRQEHQSEFENNSIKITVATVQEGLQ